MGRKFESSDFGRPGFFRRGEMSASLNFDGKEAWVNERFARCGGDEWRSDLMVDQRRLGFLEASLMHSTLDAARYLLINLFVDEHAAR